MNSSITPLISIGVQASTSIEKLDVLLASLCQQTHENLEILVAGECVPGPALVHYLRKKQAEDRRIRYVPSHGEVGRDAQNMTLLGQAKGEFFVVAIDAMRWSPRFLERCLAEIGGHGSAMSGVSVDGVVMPMPLLGSGKARHQGVLSFQRNPTAAILLGVHRTHWIKTFLREAAQSSDLLLLLQRSIKRDHLRVFDECLFDLSIPESRALAQLPDWLSQGVSDLIGPVTAKNEEIACRRRMLRKDYYLSELRDRLWGRGQSDVLPETADDSIICEGMKESFSQSGEDMIIDFIFEVLQIRHPTYLDLGAHHPRLYSNTNHFYRRGSRGVNVEADPSLCELFVEERPADVNLNVGVGVGELGVLPFYIMSVPTLNTFSRDEAERCVEMGTHRIVNVIDVELCNVNDIIKEHFSGESPDFISVDVEGLDLEIVKSLDLRRYRPVVICVETITYSENFDGEKIKEVESYLQRYGYFLYADTRVNSIFVDKSRWCCH